MAKEGSYHTETINGHTFRLRYLPGGIFDMGSDKGHASPIHKVKLSPFYIGEFLVTQALWRAVVGADSNPSRFTGDCRPVEQVSWLDIVEGSQDDAGQPAFLQKLNEATTTTRPDGHAYRLPTEAEWEYAARGGEPYEYAGSDQLKEVGWYVQDSQRETKVVGLKRPNGFQLYDMSGGVREWCMDSYSDSFYKDCYDEGIVNDPLFEEKGTQLRVVRGGSWVDGPLLSRVPFRDTGRPMFRFSVLSFRLVLVPIQRSRTTERNGHCA